MSMNSNSANCMVVSILPVTRTDSLSMHRLTWMVGGYYMVILEPIVRYNITYIYVYYLCVQSVLLTERNGMDSKSLGDDRALE